MDQRFRPQPRARAGMGRGDSIPSREPLARRIAALLDARPGARLLVNGDGADSTGSAMAWKDSAGTGPSPVRALDRHRGEHPVVPLCGCDRADLAAALE